MCSYFHQNALQYNLLGVKQMDIRVKKVENDLASLNIDMAVVKSNYATRTDIVEAKNSIVMWVVSAVILAQAFPLLLRKFGV
jgi:hypothetical protein